MLPPDGRGLSISLGLTFTSPPGDCWRVRSPSLRAQNGLVPVAEASGFPAVDVWMVSRLDSIEEVDFGNSTFFFFEADESATHSLDIFVDILIECEVHEYRCRLVDANVNRVLPREVAQAAIVPTTFVSRSLVRDVGKELHRV